MAARTPALPLLCLLLAALPARAAEPAPAARPAVAVKAAPAPLRVDGLLDEPAWATAEPASAFELMNAREGQAPDESTTVRVLRDGDRLVFGFWCQAKRQPHAGLAARDQALDGDHISVHLDTDGDGQRAYIFGVNPFGVQLDGILTADADFKWDGVWDAAAHRGEGEWTAEIAVPFRIMRISAAGRPWRMWVRREVTSWNEVASWPPYKTGTPGPIMLQAGDLTGLDGVRGGRELTVEPYVFAASVGSRALATGGATSAWHDETSREAGLDVQAAITPSLVANATFNPDFSQIEADALQIDVNRRFPLRFIEKRPFFLEGADHFHSLMDLVDTRRISDPHWGLKATGRVGAWNTGGLLVRDHGGALLAGSGYTPGSDDVLSRAGWFALGRAQLPFGRGSNFGVLSGLHSQDEPDDPANPERRTFNGFGGFDSQVRLSEHWTTEGQWIGSMTHQDGDGVSLATQHFRDWMGVWRMRYRDRARELHFGARHVGEKFRDELGYQDYAGVTYRRLGGWWDLFPKTGPLQRVAPIFDVLLVHERTGRMQLAQYLLSQDFEFRSSAFVNVSYSRDDEHYLDRTYAQDRASAFAQWTAWRPLTMDVSATFGDQIQFGPTAETSPLAWMENVSLNLTAHPEPRVTAATNVTRFRLRTRAGGDDVFALWLLGVNTTTQFTRRLSLRVYPQYDSFVKHLDVNGLVGYVIQPGTVFYAGVNSGWDRDELSGMRRATSRQYFAKASWRFAR